MPGALLIQWMLQALGQQLEGLVVASVKSVKFSSSLKPGDSCELDIHYQASDQKVRIHCRSNNTDICKAVVFMRAQ